MAQRVLTTDTARATVSEMQQLVASLGDSVSRLGQKCTTLSSPEVWDGPKAAQFRGEIWPASKAALDRMVTDLEEIRATVATINANIMEAGT